MKNKIRVILKIKLVNGKKQLYIKKNVCRNEVK